MACQRCQQALPTDAVRWCGDCERAFDTWSRRHATDVVWSVLAGMVLVSGLGLGLPLLGAGYVAATAGVFAGFGALVGMQRVNRRRRREQFRLESLPRAYLPAKT